MTTPIQKFASHRVGAAQISATSVIFTVFGDTVSQHGGSIWLSSVIDAMALFGINERLVRTSVYRLVKEDLLESERIGRCSYYRFSDAGKRYAQQAAKRIYASQPEAAEEGWVLALVEREVEGADELKRGLQWLGFQALRPGLYAHPAADHPALKQMLAEQDATELVSLFAAEPSGLGSQRRLRELVYEKWALESVSAQYRSFCRAYRPWVKKLQRRSVSAEDAFVFRTILVHEYRRILLKDPQLPDAMLPSHWDGYTAHTISKQLYQSLGPIAIDFIRTRLENANGPLPPAARGFASRFGGLKPS